MYNDFIQLISTKVYISPLPADFIPGPQLMVRLGQVFKHNLTVVSASAEFGKTTLLGAWLQEVAGQSEKILSCWLSLDAEDNDSGRFTEDLLSSFEETGIPLSTISTFIPITSTTNCRSMLNALVQDLSSLRDDVCSENKHHTQPFCNHDFASNPSASKNFLPERLSLSI